MVQIIGGAAFSSSRNMTFWTKNVRNALINFLNWLVLWTERSGCLYITADSGQIFKLTFLDDTQFDIINRR